jgi:hypothetical protein
MHDVLEEVKKDGLLAEQQAKKDKKKKKKGKELVDLIV